MAAMRDRASPDVIRAGGLELRVRRSVARREVSTNAGLFVYLSLFDDEIESRCQAFLDRVKGAAVNEQSLVLHADNLELTDAIALQDGPRRTVVARGASCTFPLFYCPSTHGVTIATQLPLGSVKLSRAGLVAGAATVGLHGSYESNANVGTPAAGWHRVRRGATMTFHAAELVRDRPIEQPIADIDPVDIDGVVGAVRRAFSAYGLSQRPVQSVLELSGGFDSTLAAVATRRPKGGMHGVSVEFPYYEFRFEAEVQRAVAAALDVSRSVLDGTDAFPYSPPDAWPRFDEPSVFVTGMRHAEKVARLGREWRASHLYVGHGGDALFSTDLSGSEGTIGGLDRDFFSRRGRADFRLAVRRTQDPAWLSRRNGCFVYDARQDVWLKETFGLTVRTPFTDLAVFRAALLWSRLNAARRARPTKTILSRTFGDLLPIAVTRRRGKVAYNGVWMRAYARHGDHIARTFEETSAVLEHIGLSPGRLLRRVRDLSLWRAVSDREVMAAYALSTWLLAWKITRVSAVAWD
jgi:asparagine synthetase B (glutamine-hydrolysing)